MSGWQFKICLIGDGFVGKTSIRRKYLKGGFKRSYIPTLGVDFAQKTLKYEGRHTNLVIWDIAGQVAYRNIRKRYYEGCAGMILVFSVADRQSFDNASKWLVEAHRFMEKLPPLIIAGNKIDLRPQFPQRADVVTIEEGKAFTERFSEKLGTPAVYIETSALRGTNIDEVFTTLVGMMIGKEMPAPREERPIPKATVETPTPTTTVETRSVSSTPVVETQMMEMPSGPEPGLMSSMMKATEEIEDEQIGRSMTKLVQLRAELKSAEEELRTLTEELEARNLNLRNLVHVKKIMYEHLQEQIRVTRQEWADAYEEYQRINQRKKSELAELEHRVEQLREQVEMAEKGIRKDVASLTSRSNEQF